MELNISTSMGYGNRNFQRNTAKQNEQKKEAENESKVEPAKTVTYTTPEVKNSDLNEYVVPTQITLNKSLKETLKYLQNHANDKRKKHILGELWEQLGDFKDENYQGELIDIKIDYNLQNIFAA